MKRLIISTLAFVAAIWVMAATANPADLPQEESLRGIALELKTYNLMAWIGQKTGYTRYAIPKFDFVEDIDWSCFGLVES